MRVEQKRNEISKYVLTNLEKKCKGLSHSQIAAISDAIVSDYCVIDLPDFKTQMKKEDKTYFLIKIPEGGIGGGRSVKTGNICLNWKKLLVEGSEIVFAVIESASNPWLIPFTGLIVSKKVLSILTVDITERHAALIWVMWKNVDNKNFIEHDVLLDLVNGELSEHNRLKLDGSELDFLLDGLNKLKCIEKNGNAWWLRERVNITYE
jgi:hypothetical protein